MLTVLCHSARMYDVPLFVEFQNPMARLVGVTGFVKYSYPYPNTQTGCDHDAIRCRLLHAA